MSITASTTAPPEPNQPYTQAPNGPTSNQLYATATPPSPLLPPSLTPQALVDFSRSLPHLLLPHLLLPHLLLPHLLLPHPPHRPPSYVAPRLAPLWRSPSPRSVHPQPTSKVP
ncbi:hypothetical protein EX30DRAFT_341846 [Ascodesmis nigricans]|uniref:Uncharacterized protein n=1 Tax=Ascodesmis nigricans TaxID=341454 RepID=A0A4S2MU34_9PEZI|nr:hypothetical protein EX30DRAFT_341846 [Ascodesmis nigricans]